MSSMSDPGLSLIGLLRRHRLRVGTAYALFLVENAAELAQPVVLGIAVRALVQRCWEGLALFAGVQLVHLTVAAIRRAWDTRVYTAAYAELAAGLVIDQRTGEGCVSAVAARSGLARQLVDFLERDLPMVLRTLLGVIGTLALLGLEDGLLALACLLAMLPAVLAAWHYARTTGRYNSHLHDQLEREVAVITAAQPGPVAQHYHRLAVWRVRLSDLEAVHVGLMQGLGLLLLLLALVRTCLSDLDLGRVVTVLGYVSVLATSLLNLPLLVEQFARLRDVARRVRGERPAAGNGVAVVLAASDNPPASAR